MESNKLLGCFDPRFMAQAIALALGVVALAVWARGFETGSAPRLALAALQAVLFGAIIVLSLRALRRLDEMFLRMHHEAITLAFGARPPP